MHHAQMKVSLLQGGLQTQCILERDLGVGKLISLRQDRSEFIAQVGAFGGEFDREPHLRQSLIPGLPAQNPGQRAVRLCILWRQLERGACLLLALGGLSLL